MPSFNWFTLFYSYFLNHIGNKGNYNPKHSYWLVHLPMQLLLLMFFIYFVMWIWVVVLFNAISSWRTPFSISHRASLFLMNSLPDKFLLIWGKPTFHVHFWRIILPDIEFLVDSLFFSALWICHFMTFWPIWFQRAIC